MSKITVAEGKKNVFWIGMNSFFTDMSSEMIKPIIPLFLMMLGANVTSISFFSNFSDIVANFGKIIFGKLSDKFRNKKWLLMLGYGLSNLFKPFLVFAGSVGFVFGIEFFNRVGKGIRSAPKEVLMVHSLPEDNRAWGFGIQKSLDSLGAFVGTILAIFMVYWLQTGIRNIFLWAIIPGAISALIVFFKIRNVTPEEGFEGKTKEKPAFDAQKVSGLGPKFWRLMVFSGIFSAGALPPVFLMLFMTTLVGSEHYWLVALFYGIYCFADSFFSWMFSKMGNALSKNMVMFIGIVAAGLAVVIPSLLTSYLGFLVGFISLGLYESTFEGVYKKYVSSSVSKEQVGTALGLNMGISGLSKLVSGFIISAIWIRWSPEYAMLFSGIIVAFSILWLVSTHILAKNEK